MKKEEFKQKTHELLNELADYITRLENKTGEIADEAKEGYRERVDNLKGLKDNLSSKLEDYEHLPTANGGSPESAADFFASVSKSWKRDFDKVADAFKKNDKNDSEATVGNQPDSDIPQ